MAKKFKKFLSFSFLCKFLNIKKKESIAQSTVTIVPTIQ